MAPLKSDWQKDVVYLIQFPRARIVPTASPFSLKMETYLRMADIYYLTSSKGQIPFIELNGLEIADSNIIIDFLENIYSKRLDEHLNDDQKADAHAYNALIEESIRWFVWYSRSKNNDWMVTSQGFGDHLSWFKRFMFKNFVLSSLRKDLVKTCNAQGIGRHSIDDVVKFCKKDLYALSHFLGQKKFLTGDKPVKVDATAFGHLCQLYYTPQVYDMKSFMDRETTNVVDYLHRIKRLYWPDWDDASRTLSLDTNWKDQKYGTNL